jgi:hypothetical protein
MAADKSDSSLKEVGEGLKSILERIADFFDIFDLSFIVSGATTISAFAFWGWRAGLQHPAIPTGWISAVGLVIACYVAGLVCFAVGRWIRMGWRSRSSEKRFHKWFVFVLDGHGLTGVPPFNEYLARKETRGDWRLYVRLWADVRQSSPLAASFSLLRRYWVMAATYDGVAIALVVWAATLVGCAFGVAGAKPIDKWLALPLTLVLLVCAVACSREAGRFVDYQVEELVASIAADRSQSKGLTGPE